LNIEFPGDNEKENSHPKLFVSHDIYVTVVYQYIYVLSLLC